MQNDMWKLRECDTRPYPSSHVGKEQALILDQHRFVIIARNVYFGRAITVSLEGFGMVKSLPRISILTACVANG
eukprot:317790-Karenia_brevis.AAC.1